ncbi:MAG: flavodoxin family protein [Eubacteriales bacterium]
MKTVVFNGSPHPHGNTEAMLRLLDAQLGGERIRFDAYAGTVRPCVDCGRCASEPCCPIPDDGAAALAAVREADCIVIASPVYFSGLTGPLVGMASRLQYVWMSGHVRGTPVLGDKKRRGVILLAGGGSGSPQPALSAARRYLHMLGAEIAAEILSGNTDRVPAGEDEAARMQILAAARRLRREFGEDGA